MESTCCLLSSKKKLLPKEYVGSGCSPLKSQQTGQFGEKESVLYFKIWQLGAEGRHLSKDWHTSPPPPTHTHPSRQGTTAFIDRAQSSLTVIFKLANSGLSRNILVVLGLTFSPSISLHWSLRKAFLCLLAILWNSAFKWVYLSFSPLLFASLLFTAICKASFDSHFAFLHFFFLGMVLIPVSCTMSVQYFAAFGWTILLLQLFNH